MRAYVLAAVLAASFAAAAPARADDTADCIAASEEAQSLRDSHSLTEAKRKFAFCARDVCPGPIKADCLEQRSAVDAALPSLVFRARDAHGNDAVDVRVTCDGVRVATRLDGTAVSVDPGPHTLRFEIPGVPPIERNIVVGEGEKDRLVVAEPPGRALRAGTADAAARAPSGDARAARATGPSIPGLVVGAIGVAAIVPMSVLWWSGTSDARDMKNSCAPSAGGPGCPPSRVDAARTKLILGDVFLGVAVAGIATGAVLLLAHPGAHSKSGTATPSPVVVGAAPLPGGVSLSTWISF